MHFVKSSSVMSLTRQRLLNETLRNVLRVQKNKSMTQLLKKLTN